MPNEIDRIVIFGHTGFIGRHLERFLKEKHPELEIIGASLPSVDLTKDSAPVKGLFGMKTAVIMLSALKREHGDNLDNFLKNVKMAVNVCKQIENNPVKRFIYFSSAAVYGEDVQNLSINEDSPVTPTTYYGIAKHSCERLLRKATGSGKGSALTILRPPIIYGPGDNSGYSPSGFAKTAMRGETIKLWGDGTEKREFIFVEDVARAVEKLVLNNHDCTLNLASGKSYTFAEIIDELSKLTNSEIKVESRKRTKEKADHGFENTALLKVFPEFSFTPLSEGLKKTIDAIKGGIE